MFKVEVEVHTISLLTWFTKNNHIRSEQNHNTKQTNLIMEWWEESDDSVACMQCGIHDGVTIPSCFSCRVQKELKKYKIENEKIKAYNNRYRTLYSKAREKVQQYDTMLHISKKQVSDLREEKEEMKKQVVYAKNQNDELRKLNKEFEKERLDLKKKHKNELEYYPSWILD